MHAADFRAIERLRDGTEVTVRAIRADDKERLLKAFRALERQSVYTRFFTAKSELTAEDLRRLTEVDHRRDVALVAILEETIIAGGRYLSTGTSAEIAFTVEEDFQRQGLASRLLRHLAHIARANGIARFEACVLAENGSMLGVFRRSGLPMRQERAGGEWRVTLELA